MAQTVKDLGAIDAPPTGVYDLDVAHTELGFVARHMLAKVRGRFTGFRGTVTIGDTPEASSAEVEIEAASLVTHTEQRDQHLKSPDFLDVEQHPTLTFASTAVRRTGATAFELDGDLTIRGITRPVTLQGQYLGVSRNPFGNTVLAATARTTLEREDWDMTWNVAIETGGWLVSKRFDIELEVEAVLREDG